MRLIESEAAQKWLAQFDTEYLAPAMELIDGIELVTRATVESTLHELIDRLGTSQMKGSVALFAVRELDPCVPLDALVPDEKLGQGYGVVVQNNGKQLEIAKHAIRAMRAGKFPPTPYFPTDPGANPNATRPGRGLGSEGTIANLIRDICARKSSPRWLDHPSIEEMRRKKTRTIVLVDDLIGSGKRVRDFVKGFCNNGTLRSWSSLGLYNLHVCTFASTMAGQEAIRLDKRVHTVTFGRQLLPGSPAWTPAQDEAVRRTCLAYARRTSRPTIPYGFGNAFTCLCFDYKCPNTAPAILWAGKAGSWTPLFDERPILDHPVWPDEVDQDSHDAKLLVAFGQSRLAKVKLSDLTTLDGRKCLLLLALASQRVRTIPRLSAALSIETTECNRLVAICQSSNWMTPSLRLTVDGKKVLNHARTRAAQKTGDITMKNDYYVPRSMRGPSD